MQAVAIYAFDCLFLNGESLLPLSLRERQQKMRPGIGSVPLGISSSVRQCALVPLGSLKRPLGDWELAPQKTIVVG